jgi:ABC-type transporter Mla subunit MlaD
VDQSDREFLAKLVQVLGGKLEDIEALTEQLNARLEQLDTRLERVVELLEERS